MWWLFASILRVVVYPITRLVIIYAPVAAREKQYKNVSDLAMFMPFCRCGVCFRSECASGKDDRTAGGGRHFQERSARIPQKAEGRAEGQQEKRKT